MPHCVRECLQHCFLDRIALGRKYACAKDHMMGLEDDFSNLYDIAKSAGWNEEWFKKKKEKVALAKSMTIEISNVFDLINSNTLEISMVFIICLELASTGGQWQGHEGQGQGQGQEGQEGQGQAQGGREQRG